MYKKQEIKIDKNVLEANIKLVDENKWLKADNEQLQLRIDKAIELYENTTINCDGQAEDLLDKITEILKGSDIND